MKPSIRIVLMYFAIVLLAAPTTVRDALAKPIRSAEFLAALKIGQWIRLEAVGQKDAPMLCTELRQMAGDFHNDDWSLRGRLENLDVVKGRFTIGPVRVHLVKNAVLEGKDGMLDGPSDLRRGMIVEVDGTYMKDGTFLAGDLDDETEEPKASHGIEQRIRIVGKIGRIDVGKRRITVMGTEFVVMDKTKLKSVIR